MDKKYWNEDRVDPLGQKLGLLFKNYGLHKTIFAAEVEKSMKQAAIDRFNSHV